MERVIMLAGGKKWAHSGLWSMPDKFDQARERSYTAEKSVLANWSGFSLTAGSILMPDSSMLRSRSVQNTCTEKTDLKRVALSG